MLQQTENIALQVRKFSVFLLHLEIIKRTNTFRVGCMDCTGILKNKIQTIFNIEKCWKISENP